MSNDCAQQSGLRHGHFSCGYYCIANMTMMISKCCQIIDIGDITKMKYWIRNLCRRNENKEMSFNPLPDKIESIILEDVVKININISRTTNIIKNIVEGALEAYNSIYCSLEDCDTETEEKILCIICREYFHLFHDILAGSDDIYNRICLPCYSVLLNEDDDS